MKEYDNLDNIDDDENDNEINLENNKYLQGEETSHTKVEKIFYAKDPIESTNILLQDHYRKIALTVFLIHD